VGRGAKGQAVVAMGAELSRAVPPGFGAEVRSAARVAGALK
jgi:hypothetical protein